MVKKPLAAKPGERVRLFVLNVGPSKTSSFHVGRDDLRPRLDRGQPRQPVPRACRRCCSGLEQRDRGIHDPGERLLHHGGSPFRQRLAGCDRADSTGAKAEERELEHHNIAASATPTDPDAVQGKLNFESKCLACHSFGQGKKLGPSVKSARSRRPSGSWSISSRNAPICSSNCATGRHCCTLRSTRSSGFTDRWWPTERITTRPVEIGGRKIGGGERISLIWISANRDGRVFEDAGAFRMTAIRRRICCMERGFTSVRALPWPVWRCASPWRNFSRVQLELNRTRTNRRPTRCTPRLVSPLCPHSARTEPECLNAEASAGTKTPKKSHLADE